MNAAEIMDQAITLVSDQWIRSIDVGSVPTNIPLLDRVRIFASNVKKPLFKSFPTLGSANDQVLLLVIAEGIVRSGTVERRSLEDALGIIMPPDY